MKNRQPNVLFLFSDEHDPRHMGASGSPLVQTPHLDALASRGTRFTEAVTPSPICVPARACLATGAPLQEIGYWDNAIAYDGRVRGWCHALAQAGHRVDSIGKLHYSKTEDPTGFTEEHAPMHIWKGLGQIWGSIRDPLPKAPDNGPMLKQIGPGLSSYNEYDLDITTRTIDWLQQRAQSTDDKPWALMVGLVAPHFPLVAPEPYFKHYPLDNIPASKLLPSDGFAHHPWIAAKDAFKCEEAYFASDPERRKLAIAAYYALCTFLDENIGRILQALTDAGLRDDTIVIYSSDHGDNIGQRALWGKSNMYRESVQVPMIVAGPDVPQNQVVHTPVSLLDIHATMLDVMQVPDIEDDTLRLSESLLDKLNHPREKRTVSSQYHAMGADNGAFMVTDGHYKYHAYVGYAPELFDLNKDPEEANNLADDPAMAPVIEQMNAELQTHLGGRSIDTVDRMAKDDQAALIEGYGGREAAMELGGTPGATPTPGAGLHQ